MDMNEKEFPSKPSAIPCIKVNYKFGPNTTTDMLKASQALLDSINPHFKRWIEYAMTVPEIVASIIATSINDLYHAPDRRKDWLMYVDKDTGVIFLYDKKTDEYIGSIKILDVKGTFDMKRLLSDGQDMDENLHIEMFIGGLKPIDIILPDIVGIGHVIQSQFVATCIMGLLTGGTSQVIKDSDKLIANLIETIGDDTEFVLTM